MVANVLLAGPARTMIGAFNGSLADVPATALGSVVIRAALERSAVAPAQVDEVIMGNVLTAGLGQNPARQAALGAVLSNAVGATTVGKVCGSGLKAVMLAAQAIRCGDASTIVAGGMESMSRAPYLLDKARNGYRLGHGELVDSILRDGLTDAYGGKHMGACGDCCAVKYSFTRQQQDDFAVASYQRARAAAADGTFAREIVPVSVPGSKGSMMTVAEDEQPRRFNEEKLRQLRPAFGEGGTITAGNASSINDGAAAVVVLSEDRAASMGVKAVARVLGYSTAAREPEWFTLAPISAIQRLMDKLSLKVSDVDLFEVNEAFAVVAMAAMKDLAIPHDRLNVHGGAVALGHPIGASGARTLVTLLNAMQSRHAKRGIVSLCIGGGEAVAMAVELI